MRLLKKELMLAMHPTGYIFLFLSAMLLIPSYPYLVMFFYMGLAVFFICLSGRENGDIAYTLSLPIAKRDVVRARIGTALLLESAQLAVAIPFAYLRGRLPVGENTVGLDAGAPLFGAALILFAIFNGVFFGVYYKNVRRVGAAFLYASVAVFLYITAVEASTHILPFVRDRLDAPGEAYLFEKCAALAVGMAVFIASTYCTYRRAVRDFEKQDLP